MAFYQRNVYFYVYSSPIALCTFDKDICGFVQDKTDQLDWRRHRGRTTSDGTGPTNDHTTGTSQGKI